VTHKNETSISKESFKMKEHFLNLTAVKFALDGKSGSMIEQFDGKESQITFLPYDIFQNKRILLLIQSCNIIENEVNKCVKNKEHSLLMRIF
jgi:hypothetical protein